MNIKDLEQILAILRANDVTDFELEQEGTHIRLTRLRQHAAGQIIESTGVAASIEPAIVGSQGATVVSSSIVSAPVNGHKAELPSNLVKVESPIVGTFYRRPAPDAEPFVKEGDRVEKGDTLCIVEAMKLMNEIDAPSSGRIERIMLSEGQVVEFGEVLFLINPN